MRRGHVPKLAGTLLGMNLHAFDKLMEICSIPVDEWDELRRGARILEAFGWPENYIDFNMCRRAVAGFVPRYEGRDTFNAYRQRWAREDQAGQQGDIEP